MKPPVFESVGFASVWDEQRSATRRIRQVVNAMIHAGLNARLWPYAQDLFGNSYCQQDCQAVEPMIDICDWFQQLPIETD